MLSPGSRSSVTQTNPIRPSVQAQPVASHHTQQQPGEYIPVSTVGVEDTFRDLTPRRAQYYRPQRQQAALWNDHDTTTTIDVTPVVPRQAPTATVAADSGSAEYFSRGQQQHRGTSVEHIMQEHRLSKQHQHQHQQQAQDHVVVVQAIPVDALNPIYMSPPGHDMVPHGSGIVVAAESIGDVVTRYLPQPSASSKLVLPSYDVDPSNPRSVGDVHHRISAVRSLVAVRALEQIEAVERQHLVEDESSAIAWVVLKLREEYGRSAVTHGWERSTSVLMAQCDADLRRVCTFSRHQGDIRAEEDAARKRLLNQYVTLAQSFQPQVELLYKKWRQQVDVLQLESAERSRAVSSAFGGLALLKQTLVELVEEAERREVVAGRLGLGQTVAVSWFDSNGSSIPDESFDFMFPRSKIAQGASTSVSGWMTSISNGKLLDAASTVRRDCFGRPQCDEKDSILPYFIFTLKVPHRCWYREPPLGAETLRDYTMIDFLLPLQQPRSGLSRRHHSSDDSSSSYCEIQCTPLEYFSLIRPVLQFVLAKWSSLKANTVSPAWNMPAVLPSKGKGCSWPRRSSS